MAVAVETNGGRVTITLDRPAKRNALTRAMLSEVLTAVEGARAAQAVVLTGAGAVFSAGADLAEAKAGLATDPIWEEVTGAIAAHPGLTIARLPGPCAGGALGLALACDLRVAAGTAEAFYPVMRLGFLPQPSDPGRLVALVGPSRAKALLVAGARWSAADGLAAGLWDRVAPGELLDGEVDALCEAVLAATPAHLAAIKAMIPG